MCRFMAYLGTPCLLADLVTKPSRSLTRQSYDAKERLTGHGYLNGDGFGIGWYSQDHLHLPHQHQHEADPTPCVFSSIQPAWNNQNLERLANKIISPLIFAHVRAAYPGIAVNDSNCQPFTCGRYMWMHNGGVGGFHKVRRKLLNSLKEDVFDKCPSFESDSAICFGLFLNHISDPMRALSPEDLVARMEATINDIWQIQIQAGVEDEKSLLNFVVSDGQTVVATRYCNLPSVPAASLYYAFGSKFECVDRETNAYFVQHQDRRGQIGIVASEPLTDSSADWIKVPQNHMVVMTRCKGEFLDVLLFPISAPQPVVRDISRSFKALASGSKQRSRVSVTGRSPVRRLGEPRRVQVQDEADGLKAGKTLSTHFSLGPGDASAPSAGWPQHVRPPEGVPLVTGPRHAMVGQSCPILSLAVDCDRVFVGFQDGLIRIYSLTDFTCERTFQAHRQNIFSLAVHNGLLYTSSTRVVKIWDARTLELRAHLRYSDGDVFALALALGRSVAGPAGTTIVACSPSVTSSKQPALQPHASSGGARLASVPETPEAESRSQNGAHPEAFPCNSGDLPEGSDGHARASRDSVGKPVVAVTNGGGRCPPCGGDGRWEELEAQELREGLKRGGMEDSVGNMLRLEERSHSRKGARKPPAAPPEPGGGTASARQDAANGQGPVFDTLASNAGNRVAGAGGSVCPLGPAVASAAAAVPPAANGAAVDGPAAANGLGPCAASHSPSPGAAVKPVPGAIPCAAAAAATAAAASAPCKATAPSGAGVQCNEIEAALALTDALRGGHCSRVYTLALCGSVLCSGAGDSFVKAWDLEKGECMGTLLGHKGSVLALAAYQEPGHNKWCLLSGSRDNTVRVWDLCTLTCITTLTGHVDDVVALDTAHAECKGFQNTFLSASSDQTIRLWSLDTYECLQVFLLEDCQLMSVAATPTGFVTGSSDGVVHSWELNDPQSTFPRTMSPSTSFRQQPSSRREEHQQMEEMLAQLVRIRSVAQERTPSSTEQAWKAANFLMGLMESLGAEAKLVVSVEDTNPIVFGRIIQDPSKLTVTICGHYDVADVASEAGWRTPPFELTAVNGNLYGRGVSTSKGPLIATLFAVKELVCSGELGVNINFVIDGEHERGCRGFKEAVTANAEWFEDTGLILTASGAWITDEQPCLTYGMRGLICLVVEVTGPKRDLHSGTHGGVFNEPLNDLVTVLSNLVDSNNMILIPGFYDDVKPMDEEEHKLYNRLQLNLEEYKITNGLKALTGSNAREVLQSCWRDPSLSIVSVDSSPGTWSLIPKRCSARVVIRHVPDQNPERLIERFKAHVAHEFAKLRSRGNAVSVHVQHIGDWWLADPSCSFYELAEQAVERQWAGAPPTMYIREGGTMHIVPFLKHALGAPAIIVPISQATDYSALQNERLSLKHFLKGKNVIRDFLTSLGEE